MIIIIINISTQSIFVCLAFQTKIHFEFKSQIYFQMLTSFPMQNASLRKKTPHF